MVHITIKIANEETFNDNSFSDRTLLNFFLVDLLNQKEFSH